MVALHFGNFRWIQSVGLGEIISLHFFFTWSIGIVHAKLFVYFSIKHKFFILHTPFLKYPTLDYLFYTTLN